MRLRYFKDMHMFGQYISFHVARQNSHGTITMQICAARKVLNFLASKASETEELNISKIKIWLTNVNTQLESVVAKPVQAPIRLPQAHEVVRKIESLRLQALQSIPPPGMPITPVVARLLHDACLACMMFSYLPPVRLVSLRNLQSPMTTGCHFKGCKIEKCQGNRLELKDGQLTMVLIGELS